MVFLSLQYYLERIVKCIFVTVIVTSTERVFGMIEFEEFRGRIGELKKITGELRDSL